MTTDPAQAIRVECAELILPCPDLPATLAFFTERLSFRIETIHPADAPTVAVIIGHGLRIRLQHGSQGAPSHIRLHCTDLSSQESELVAPNGTRIQVVQTEADLILPPLEPSYVLSQMHAESTWHEGRAGMQYRDLIPDRQGGRFIASHIRILDGGPVPDYVHFHKIRFQMIYCYKGWVRVVYEDQGPPFVLRAGDCVLQPPKIRHQVIESSPGLEVIEIGCPAEHATCADHTLRLPSESLMLDRDFSGQRFVRHQVDHAVWHPWQREGFEARDIGISTATDGLAGAQVVRRIGAEATEPEPMQHDSEFVFRFVLQGRAVLTRDGREPQTLNTGDAFVIPAGVTHSLSPDSTDLQFLEVTLPGSSASGKNIRDHR